MGQGEVDGPAMAPLPAVAAVHPHRHPGETPLFVIAILCTAIIYGFALDLFGVGDLPVDVSPVLLLPLLVLVIRGFLYGQARANAIKITPQQFPEVHQMIVEIAQAFNLKQVPPAYVELGNGAINAFASGHGRRRFIVVTADLFEVGAFSLGPRIRDPQALRFVIAHEIGHIAARHVSYTRSLVRSVVQFIPPVERAWSRSQEYTADNYAYAVDPQGARKITILAGGKYLYTMTDFDAIADRAATERGFFIWMTNMLSSHPVNIKRFAALRDRSKAGKLFF